jgi:hypothetical protein
MTKGDKEWSVDCTILSVTVTDIVQQSSSLCKLRAKNNNRSSNSGSTEGGEGGQTNGEGGVEHLQTYKQNERLVKVWMAAGLPHKKSENPNTAPSSAPRIPISHHRISSQKYFQQIHQ